MFNKILFSNSVDDLRKFKKERKENMKTFFQKVFAIVLTLTILVSALPVGAISVLAAEVSNPADAQIGDTFVTKTDAAPEDVDGGIWVLDKEGYTCSILEDYAEHTHGDGSCLYTCSHNLLVGHKDACYGEGNWALCEHGESCTSSQRQSFSGWRLFFTLQRTAFFNMRYPPLIPHNKRGDRTFSPFRFRLFRMRQLYPVTDS